MTGNASRALDLVVASLALAVTSPLLAAAAVMIKLESRGPVFYRQRRVGLRGAPFELWKLRTMVPGAEAMGAGIYVVEYDHVARDHVGCDCPVGNGQLVEVLDEPGARHIGAQQVIDRARVGKAGRRNDRAVAVAEFEVGI